MMNAAYEEFSQKVLAAGLVPRLCSQYHYQIKGGALLVNYHPNDKGLPPTIYVAQTTGGFRGSVEDVIAAANTLPESRGRKDRRRKGYKTRKQWMLDKDPFCHWCKCPLTLDTATLDHVVPLSRGGLDNANNWVLACEPCNRGRGSDMPELVGVQTATDDSPPWD